jgi:type IV secretion system protein VirD4
LRTSSRSECQTIITDAREISDELGFTTVKAKSISSPLWDVETRGRRGRSQSVSEQRRALLLPQEVKELGTEEAIVFYEGLRPIRCRKIRYFSDPRFRERLLPPPARPAPQWLPPAAVDEAREPAGTAAAAGGDAEIHAQVPLEHRTAPESAPATREATVEDIERWDELTLEDFAADFSKVKIPDHEGPMSSEELQAAVDSFLDTLRQH